MQGKIRTMVTFEGAGVRTEKKIWGNFDDTICAVFPGVCVGKVCVLIKIYSIVRLRFVHFNVCNFLIKRELWANIDL